MENKPKIAFNYISERLSKFPFPEIDVVIGIARGGVVPAALIAHQLKKPLELIRIQYRNEQNKPVYILPVVFSGLNHNRVKDKTILLVDDVSVSGNTLETAAKQLHADKIYTFVLKGRADYVLLPEIQTCVQWPWNLETYMSLQNI